MHSWTHHHILMRIWMNCPKQWQIVLRLSAPEPMYYVESRLRTALDCHNVSRFRLGTSTNHCNCGSQAGHKLFGRQMPSFEKECRSPFRIMKSNAHVLACTLWFQISVIIAEIGSMTRLTCCPLDHCFGWILKPVGFPPCPGLVGSCAQWAAAPVCGCLGSESRHRGQAGRWWRNYGWCWESPAGEDRGL